MIYVLPLMILAGFIADLIFGDPQWFPHPVRLIGRFAGKLENSLINRTGNKKIAGTLFAVAVILVSAAAAALLTLPFFVIAARPALSLIGMMYIEESSNIVALLKNNLSIAMASLGFILSAFLIYSSLAIKDLKVESMKVYESLKSCKIEDARFALSRIVSRDTEGLKEEDIIRAAVETVAENSVDGILSPMFYAFLGGPVAAVAFKAASTLDSMVGYKNNKYKDFGMASAKIDDWTNFIPARLSIALFLITGLLLGKSIIKTFRTIIKFRKNNPSPNSGIPESAIAGILGLRLGGFNYYGRKRCFKPFIGEKEREFEKEDIRRTVRIVYIFTIISYFSLAGLYFLLVLLINVLV
ncbi:MAG: adenosylcobinamide-phosphate synthase CbiB [Candidatus Humimicrobiaceae bacterium]